MEFTGDLPVICFLINDNTSKIRESAYSTVFDGGHAFEKKNPT